MQTPLPSFEISSDVPFQGQIGSEFMWKATAKCTSECAGVEVDYVGLNVDPALQGVRARIMRKLSVGEVEFEIFGRPTTSGNDYMVGNSIAELPKGLSLDEKTGVVAGTPLGAATNHPVEIVLRIQ